MDLPAVTPENYYSPEMNMAYMGSTQFKAFEKCEAAALAELRGEYTPPTSQAFLIGGYIDAWFSGELPLYQAQHPEIFKRDGTLKAEYVKAAEIVARLQADELYSMLMSGKKQVIRTGFIAGVPFKVKIDSLLDANTCNMIANRWPHTAAALGFCDGAIVDQKIMRDTAEVWSDEDHCRLPFVEAYMVERAWNGEDMNMSATALSQAVNAMAESVENYIRENASPDVTGGADAPDETETSPPEITELPEPDTSSMRYIFDLAGCLSSDSRTKLEARAEEISTRHSCGVYVAFVDDYKVYSQGGDVYEGTYRFYHDKQLGMGDGRDGVIVLLSMQNRKYAMFIYGENAAYAINGYGAEQLEGRFLGQFSDGNWYIGAAEYLTACDEYLGLAEAGKPVRESPWAVIAIVVIVSCLIASGVCKVLKMNMKTVRRGAAADEYVTGEGLALTESSDRFMYTTETRTKIKSDSSDGGGGGSTSSCSGGGGHGRSGSF